jgi:hypothetical protein
MKSETMFRHYELWGHTIVALAAAIGLLVIMMWD